MIVNGYTFTNTMSELTEAQLNFTLLAYDEAMEALKKAMK